METAKRIAIPYSEEFWLLMRPIFAYTLLSVVFALHATISEDLEQAVENNDFNAAKAAIDFGVKVNFKIKTGKFAGFTPVMVAAFQRNSKIVKLLVDAKADLGSSGTPVTPLLLAVACSYLDDLDQVTPAYDSKECTEVVQILLEAKANPNPNVTLKGETPLTIAAVRGHSEIADLLIEAGANINAKNKAGRTALLAASARGHLDIVRLLIGAKAQVNLKNNHGETALMLACMGLDESPLSSEAPAQILANHLSIVKLLLSAGADPNAKAKDGTTASYQASKRGLTEIVETLRKAGAIK